MTRYGTSETPPVTRHTRFFVCPPNIQARATLSSLVRGPYQWAIERFAELTLTFSSPIASSQDELLSARDQRVYSHWLTRPYVMLALAQALPVDPNLVAVNGLELRGPRDQRVYSHW